MIAEEVIEKFAYVNRAKVTKRSVNVLSVLKPLAVFVSYSEKFHYGEVIADHEVETYRIFDPVNDRSLVGGEYVDYSRNFSFQQSRNAETERFSVDEVFVYVARSSIRTDICNAIRFNRREQLYYVDYSDVFEIRIFKFIERFFAKHIFDEFADYNVADSVEEMLFSHIVTEIVYVFVEFMLENYFRSFNYSALDVGHKLVRDVYSVDNAYVEQVGQDRENILAAAYPAVSVLCEVGKILDDIADFDYAELAVLDSL